MRNGTYVRSVPGSNPRDPILGVTFYVFSTVFTPFCHILTQNFLLFVAHVEGNLEPFGYDPLSSKLDHQVSRVCLIFTLFLVSTFSGDAPVFRQNFFFDFFKTQKR